YGVMVDEAKDAAVAAFAERTSLVGKLNKINEEIKAKEEQLFWLTHYLDVKPFHDKYMSLKGRKQQKYADRFDAELYRYSVWENDLKKVYPKKFPTVNQLEDYIEKLKGKRDKKNAEYVIADQKSRELSEAAREIEEFFHKELVQSRDQQKKRKRNDIE
ncbi:MAG: relaxase, partial [Oscillospiraceae bacterium]|nr:relaxase [Oscillospiraceae bacterium]